MIHMELTEQQQMLIGVLRRARSMPFLELASLSEFRDQQLSELLSELEAKDLVKITHKGNFNEQIVIAKEKAFQIL